MAKLDATVMEGFGKGFAAFGDNGPARSAPVIDLSIMDTFVMAAARPDPIIIRPSFAINTL